MSIRLKRNKVYSHGLPGHWVPGNTTSVLPVTPDEGSQPCHLGPVRTSKKSRKKYLTAYTVRYTVCITQWVLHSMTIEPNLFENLRLELRRGSLILAVLAQLRTEQYGYTLRKALAEHGMAIDEGTLYPLLRRLESQGLLVSEWREEDKRNKRFYLLSADGKAMLKQLLVEWKSIDSSLNGIVRR